MTGQGLTPEGSAAGSPIRRLFASDHRPRVVHLVWFFIAYTLAGRLGHGLELIPGVDIIFWPPVGILIALLLLNPPSSWPWWLAAGGLAELTCNAMWFHNPLPFALIYYSGNALESLTAAYLINRVAGRRFKFESLKDVMAFVALGAGIAPMVSATVIATTDALIGKHAFWTAWGLVWLGDSSGLLVSAPLTFLAVQTWRERARISLAGAVELGVLFGLLAGASWLAVRGYLPTVYATLPLVLWASIRFFLRGAAMALGTITLITALFTAEGSAPDAGSADPQHEAVVILQMFLGISAVSALVVAALSHQRHEALAVLRNINSELEERVKSRTAMLRDREERLRESHRFITEITNIAPSVFYVFDLAERRTLFINRACASALGYSPEEIQEWGAGFLPEALHPDDRDLIGGHFERLRGAADGEAVEVEYRLRHRDGGWRWFLSRDVAYQRGPDGRVRQIIGVASDVTERKGFEVKLRDSEERFRLASDAAGALVYDIDLTGCRPHRVYGLERVTGFNPADVPLTSEWWHGRIHPKDLPGHLEELQRHLAKGGIRSASYRFQHADGPWRSVEDTAELIRDGAGNPKRLVGTIRDITDRKQAEEALNAARRALEAANQDLENRVNERTAELSETVAVLEQFSYSLAHDLRAPLRSMASYAALILEEHQGELKGAALDYLKRIAAAAKRMDDLILDVLTCNQAARFEATLGAIDLDRLVSAVVEQYPNLRDRNAEIQISSPLLAVTGHAAMLTQCVSNLLGNGVKFVAQDKTPRIKVWTEARGGRVRLCFQDNGIGIPREWHGKIWNIFERVRHAHEFPGTGIGLSIVKSAVERMGGSVGLSSIVGEGSTFWIELRGV